MDEQNRVFLPKTEILGSYFQRKTSFLTRFDHRLISLVE